MANSVKPHFEWPWRKEQSVKRKAKLKRRKAIRRKSPKVNKLFAKWTEGR